MSTEVAQVGVDPIGARKRPWSRILWTLGVFLALAIFVGLFYKQTFTGLTDRHAMDVAQVARNISSGNGFTTRLVRPFNVALISNPDKQFAEINTAPAFPHAVATVFKLRGASDQTVIWVSMLFLLITAVVTYALGKHLFGWRVGLLAAALVGVSLPILRDATSGTEWTMAGCLFMLTLFVVALHHGSMLKPGRMSGVIYPAAAAVLLALLFMTNHVLLWLIIPLGVYFGVTGPGRRLHLIVFAAVAVLAVAPWAIRNATLTGGSILGANAWDVMSHTTAFPGDVIYRSTDAANLGVARAVLFPIERFWSFTAKLMTGSTEVLQATLAALGLGIMPFAFVSMLYRFKVPSANALRGFVYGATALLVPCFALFSVDPKAVVLLAPVVAIFGSAYFFLLLDAKALHPIYARAAVGVLVLVTAWPGLSATLWRSDTPELRAIAEANRYYVVVLAQRGFRGLVYADVPWIAALRTEGTAVWLPRTDADVTELTAAGLPMQGAILTDEADTYSSSEVWYKLHGFDFWRRYLNDPNKCKDDMAQIAAGQRIGVDQVERGLREMKRQLALSDSVSECSSTLLKGPLDPDTIVVVQFPPR